MPVTFSLSSQFSLVGLYGECLLPKTLPYCLNKVQLTWEGRLSVVFFTTASRFWSALFKADVVQNILRVLLDLFPSWATSKFSLYLKVETAIRRQHLSVLGVFSCPLQQEEKVADFHVLINGLRIKWRAVILYTSCSIISLATLYGKYCGLQVGCRSTGLQLWILSWVCLCFVPCFGSVLMQSKILLVEFCCVDFSSYSYSSLAPLERCC